MPAYLTVAEFKPLSLMPDEDIVLLETRYSTFLSTQLTSRSAWIDSRLRKRYAVPFTSPYPEAVTGWLAAIVTVRAYLKRGVDPNDEQWLQIKADADAAIAEIKEAADSEAGLFDLPLIAGGAASAISKGAPMGYSEASPHVFMDGQAERGREEDANGTGTSDA